MENTYIHSKIPSSRFREDVHQGLRRADGAQSPVYRAVRKRPEDGSEALPKDRAEVAALTLHSRISRASSTPCTFLGGASRNSVFCLPGRENQGQASAIRY